MRLIRIKFLCGMILLMGSQGVFAEIDPYYLSSPSCVIDRGNPARTGEYVAEPLIKNHEVKWAVDVPGRASLICYNNSIIANGPTVIDINTGKISWQVYNQFFGSGNLLYKEKLYATSDQIDGTSVVEYDPATGKKVMQISNEHNKHGGFSPLAYNDILYFNVSNSIVAYDLKNKKIVWRFIAPGKNTQTSPVSTDGKYIYFGDWFNTIYALDMKTGKIIWATQGIGSGSNYIVIYDSKAYVFYKNLYAIDTETGKILWKKSISSPRNGSLAVSDNRVFLSNGAVMLYAFDAYTGKELWRYQCQPASSPIIVGKVIYVLTYQNKVSALNKNRGTLLWEQSIPPDSRNVGIMDNSNDSELMAYKNGLFIAGPYRTTIRF